MAAEILLINLFAGAGGLAEGFCPVGQQCRFRIVLTVEKNSDACRTLRLRNFCRLFPTGALPGEYYRLLRREILDEALWLAWPAEAQEAQRRTWQAEIGKPNSCDDDELDARITSAIGGAESWVLVGGPPCQAYSKVGRNRNKGNPDYRPEDDTRVFLYREYLKVLGRHRPSAFVLENVLGLLSSSVYGRKLFPPMIEHLAEPSKALRHAGVVVPRIGYRLYCLNGDELRPGEDDLRRLVVRTEELGLPQTRHRMIVIGIREDIKGKPARLTFDFDGQPTGAGRVIEDLPRLRSGLSRGRDTPEAWREVISSAIDSAWLAEAGSNLGDRLQASITEAVQVACTSSLNRGGEFMFGETEGTSWMREWYRDTRLEVVLNHHSKEHMPSDLHRYLFVAAYAKTYNDSPRIALFPRDLLPAHKNALSGKFPDRFRAQLPSLPAKTITSHISQDGHYFIHPDPSQCRSLTVREAARIQTFPDNFLFLGGKVAQYIQVGNAVPPLLARLIADQVFAALS